MCPVSLWFASKTYHASPDDDDNDNDEDDDDNNNVSP